MGVMIRSSSSTELFLYSPIHKIDFEDIQSSSKWISIDSDHQGKKVKCTSYL